MSQAARYTNRESWLEAAVEILRRELFEKLDLRAESGEGWPGVRVSVGLAGAKAISSGKKVVLGECWSPECDKEAARQIFISPIEDDASNVLSTLAHELVHAVLPHEVRHGRRFVQVGKEIGLEGKATHMAAGEDLRSRFLDYLDDLGPYPHVALTGMISNAPKPQKNRQIKMECPECGYTARAAMKWLEVGLPTCPCGTKMASEAIDITDGITEEEIEDNEEG